MSLFDSIRYPISDAIRPEEVGRLPQALLEAIGTEMHEEKIYKGMELSQLMRRVIREWEEPNDNL